MEETRNNSIQAPPCADRPAENSRARERFSAYVVIPAEVYFDRRLSSRAILLYGLISNMCSQKRYCWAKNDTLCRYLNISSDRTLRELLRELKDGGYIRVEQSNVGGKTVRKIWLAIDFSADRPAENSRPARQKTAAMNSISNNNPPKPPLKGAAQRSRRRSTEEVKMPEALEESWKRFYDAYPVKKDKQKARDAWLRLSPDPQTADTIVEAVEDLKTSDPDWIADRIPYPSTFLRNRRWEDVEALADASLPPEARGVKIL